MGPFKGVREKLLGALVATENLVVHRTYAKGSAEPDNLYLSGNFAPVTAEILRTGSELPIVGQIPSELDGVYLRNGPNPQFSPAGGYHWFDGDGMLHAVRLQNGKALSYANHFVRTKRYELEQAHNGPVAGKIGDMAGFKAMVKRLLDPAASFAAGTANTALEFHAGKLMALIEGDAPYAVKILCDGALETLGAVTFGGKLKHPCTAHPKICPHTGELVFFGYQCDKEPWMTLSVADASGALLRSTAIQLRFPQMCHDFAVTRNYAIIMDLPLMFDPQVMVSLGKLPFVYDKARGARFGVIRRDSCDSASIQWFDAPGCMIFHTVCAYEEEGPDGSLRVRLLACAMDRFDLDLPGTKLGDAEKLQPDPKLTEFVFDLKKGGEAAVRVLTPLPADLTGMDFPRVHPAVTGAPCRFGYFAGLTGVIASGVLKVDLLTGEIVGRVRYPKGHFSGEAVFVPRRGAGSAASAVAEKGKVEGAEDDGFLLAYVTKQGGANSSGGDPHTSELWVMDAKSMADEPVAKVQLPQRVPWGFHGLWVTADDLAAQQGRNVPL